METNGTTVKQLLQKETAFTKKNNLNWRQIAMLYPVYQENGRNACRVYYGDGSYDLVNMRADTLLERMADMYYVKIKELEKQSRNCFENKLQRRLCLKFADDCTIVPLICREVAKRNSGGAGYAVLERLHEIVRLEDGSTLLKFSPNHKGIHITQKESTVRQQLVYASQLDRCYREQKAAAQALLLEQAQDDQTTSQPHKPPIGHYTE